MKGVKPPNGEIRKIPPFFTGRPVEKSSKGGARTARIAHRQRSFYPETKGETKKNL